MTCSTGTPPIMFTWVWAAEDVAAMMSSKFCAVGPMFWLRGVHALSNRRARRASCFIVFLLVESLLHREAIRSTGWRDAPEAAPWLRSRFLGAGAETMPNAC